MRLDQFIFCELARKEASGQFTLIGMITGNELTLLGESSGGPFLLPMFSILAVLDYMQGVTEFESQCEVMRGTEVVQRTPRSRDRRENPSARFHAHSFTFTPFAAPGPGEYTFKLIFDASGKVQSFSRKLTFKVAASRSH